MSYFSITALFSSREVYMYLEKKNVFIYGYIFTNINDKDQQSQKFPRIGQLNSYQLLNW